MKIVVFGPQRRVGALLDDSVVDLQAAYAAVLARRGEPLPARMAEAIVPSDLQAFIEGGRRTLDGAGDALALAQAEPGALGPDGEAIRVPAASVELHAPLPSGSTRIFNAGGNYRDHVLHALARMNPDGTKSPEELLAEFRSRGQMHFLKSTRNVVASGTPVMYPARTNLFDYEGEVVVVLGKAGRDIAVGDFADYVWGYTLQNDLSIREMPNMMNFGHYKNFDGSCPLGPCIVVDELPDAQDVPFTTHVSGQLRQDGNTRDMIFDFAEILAYVSTDQTVQPGDMVSAGTCRGTAMDSSERDADGNPLPDLFLKVGDVVEVTSPAIGTLRTEIIAKA